MANKRIEFTDNKKAAIYARDRATCAFSGVSLWLLDYGIRPNWQMDWVDHVKPSASGGGAELGNGVCASHTFNAKKRSNASDNVYFFNSGTITKNYVLVFGCPPSEIIQQLDRLKNLDESHWFFNRCIANVFIGFDWRCKLEFDGVRHKRDDVYWFNAAWKRLKHYRKIQPQKTILELGLCSDPSAQGVGHLLGVEFMSDQKEFSDWIEIGYKIYRENYRLFHFYFSEGACLKVRTDLLSEAIANEQINTDLLKALRTHFDLNSLNDSSTETNLDN